MKNILKQIRIGGWLAILGSSSHLLNYLTLLFLVRTLDTAEYAVYGYAVSIMSILGVVAVFLPDLVSRILLEMGDSHKMTLAQFNHLETLILKALIALGAIFILFAWQDISPFKGLSIPFVISMQTVLIAAHLNGFYAGILNFDGRFVRVLLSNAALTAGRFVGILLICHFWEKETAQQILLIWILAAGFCCLSLRKSAVLRLKNEPQEAVVLSISSIWVPLRAALPIVLSSALVLILANLDMAIVGQRFTKLTISEYSAASALAKIPYYAMQSLFSFFLVELYRRKSQKRELVSLIGGVNVLILLGGAFYLSFLKYFDSLIYSILLGGRYKSGIDLLMPLTLASLALTLLNFNLLTIALFNRLAPLKMSYVSLIFILVGTIYCTENSNQIAVVTSTSIMLLAIISIFFVFDNVKGYQLQRRESASEVISLS